MSHNVVDEKLIFSCHDIADLNERDDIDLDSERVYLWNSYVETKKNQSLMQYIEKNSNRLRSKYLSYLHELSEYRVSGKRIVEHLALEEGLSFWWLTLLAEKNPWKTPAITDVIRFFAIEEILIEESPHFVILVGGTKDHQKALKALCSNLDIDFEWKKDRVKFFSIPSMYSLYRKVPLQAQGIISFILYVSKRWNLKKSRINNWFSGKNTVFICSYLFNFSVEQANEKKFYSRYWQGLHVLMKKLELRTNWMHLYYSHESLGVSIKQGVGRIIDWLFGFNKQRDLEGSHSILDAYLSKKIIWLVLKRWFFLNKILFRLNDPVKKFQPHKSKLFLWPVIKDDWKNSLVGPAAIVNLIHVELFDLVFKDMPYQSKGIYVCENQSWERILAHRWEKYKHGMLVGVAHATVRFWDLRYFSDERVLIENISYAMPRPELVALNGQAAVSAFLENGFPQQSIYECEALRYCYLQPLLHLAKENNQDTHSFLVNNKSSDKFSIKILILGDFILLNTEKLLFFLNEAAPFIKENISFIFKPHPNCMVKKENYPMLNLTIITHELGKVLPDCQMAISGNLTSASVDAYLFGLSVFIVLNGSELNFSPLRGCPDVIFVSAPRQLSEAIKKVIATNEKGKIDNDFLFIDNNLPKWEKLLEAC